MRSNPLRLRNRLIFLLALGGLATLAPRTAQAVSFLAVSPTLDAANSANLFNDAPAISEIRQSTLSLLVSNATTFSTRYQLVVGTDIGNAATLTVNHTASYTISFGVDALAGEAWVVDLASSWSGALTLVNDASGPANVSLSAVTGTLGGTVGSLSSGTLSLAAVGTLSSNFGGNQAFQDVQAAQISGIGGGTVTLNFTWTASAQSVRGPTGSNRGDEAALRMGIDTGMSSYTADNYPGLGNRLIGSDGHFVVATITALAPEPGAIALALGGLAALLVAGRSRAGA